MHRVSGDVHRYIRMFVHLRRHLWRIRSLCKHDSTAEGKEEEEGRQQSLKNGRSKASREDASGIVAALRNTQQQARAKGRECNSNQDQVGGYSNCCSRCRENSGRCCLGTAALPQAALEGGEHFVGHCSTSLKHAYMHRYRLHRRCSSCVTISSD